MAEDVTRAGPEPLDDPSGDPSSLPAPRDRPETRPEPAGEPETLPELRVEDVPGLVDRRRRGGPPIPPSTYAPRFRALTGGLVGMAIGALVAAAVALFGHGFESGPPWSAWKPTKSGSAGAAEIAKHVAPAYRLPTGDQLVLVRGGPPRVASLTEVPVRIAVSGENPASTISEVEGNSVLYVLQGLGEDGAISEGRPSVERFLLLRREALELALYTFRYLKGVDNVVALLPPAPGEKPQNALFFRKGQLKPALERPLSSTLPAPPPSVNSVDEAPEAGMVRQLTDRSLFRYSFRQANDLSAYLVLNRSTG